MFVNDLSVDSGELNGNPSVSVSTMTIKKTYDFPDQFSYFILSSAGKEYRISSNNSILLNPAKGYYSFPFSIDMNQPEVIEGAKMFFNGSSPLSGEAILALRYALKKAGKNRPILSGRL